MSDLQAVRKQIYKLSVLERLELVETIVQSLQEELRPRPQLPADFVDRMIGLAKTDSPPLCPPGALLALPGGHSPPMQKWKR